MSNLDLFLSNGFFLRSLHSQKGGKVFFRGGEELEKREWNVKIYFLELVVMN